MNEREQAKQIIDKLPDYKISNILLFLQGIVFDDDMEDNLYCEKLYQNYLNDPDPEKDNGRPFEECLKEWDIIKEADFMNALPIEDMSNTFVEHTLTINNFVVMVGKQISDSLCRVIGEGMQYQWRENDNKIVIPDASIICNIRDRKNVSLTGIPRMIMEVISHATEKYDRGEKMEIYRKAGVSEYWIVDWRKKQVEIYLNDGNEDGETYFYLYKTVTEENKGDLQLVMFPNIKTDFDTLFNI